MISLLIRFVIAIVFAILATLFLSMSFFFLKESGYLKNNIIIASIFATLLFVFSFFSNVILTILILLITLIIVKYVCLKTWQETFNIWGVWIGLWVVLILFLTTIVWVIKPLPALI